MSKAFFRWLRGELNGFYIRNLYDTLNKSTEDIKDFLVQFENQQFKIDEIEDDNLFGIGKFAGVFLPRISQSDTLSSLFMTNSKEVDGVEFSERGLFYQPLEAFKYYHLNLDSYGVFRYRRTDSEEYDTDINTLAETNLKSSLVGNEDVRLGYVSENVTDLINPDGTINVSRLTPTPPLSGAYNAVYGDKFSFLSEGDSTDLDLNTQLTLSESCIVDDVEYSERGLYKPPMLDYPDINTLANNEERSSLVGNDDEIIGYISETETDIFDDYGYVKEDKILAVPPAEGGYSEFYGNKFLFLSEGETTYSRTDPSLFIELYKAMQWARYNGTSMKSLAEIVSVICPNGLVKISNIIVSVDGKAIYVYYDYNDEVLVTFKKQRLSLLEHVVDLKFKQVILIENEVEE